jgi:S-adenosylmethionine-dependent methyltransferase
VLVGDAGEMPRFAPGVAAWRTGLGRVRDAVRQELVTRQLAAHLLVGLEPLLVLDAGCGQGTQALALARLGHRVVGVDTSKELLDVARDTAAGEPAEIAARIRFEPGDLLHLSDDHASRYDLVCCHGVAMYLPSLEGTVRALVEVARPGGLVSLVTRNRVGIAMRAGMSGDWTGALASFDARHYVNRLGIEAVRADEPGEVVAALAAAGATTLTWYGVRLFCDHWEAADLPPDFPSLLDAEEEAGRRDPYRSLAALTHVVAQTANPRT